LIDLRENKKEKNVKVRLILDDLPLLTGLLY